MKRAHPIIRACLPSDCVASTPDNYEKPWKPIPTVFGADGLYKLDSTFWITISQASKRFKVDPSTILQWIRKQEVVAMLGEVGNRENVWHVAIESVEDKVNSTRRAI